MRRALPLIRRQSRVIRQAERLTPQVCRAMRLAVTTISTGLSLSAASYEPIRKRSGVREDQRDEPNKDAANHLSLPPRQIQGSCKSAVAEKSPKRAEDTVPHLAA